MLEASSIRWGSRRDPEGSPGHWPAAPFHPRQVHAVTYSSPHPTPNTGLRRFLILYSWGPCSSTAAGAPVCISRGFGAGWSDANWLSTRRAPPHPGWCQLVPATAPSAQLAQAPGPWRAARAWTGFLTADAQRHPDGSFFSFFFSTMLLCFFRFFKV